MNDYDVCIIGAGPGGLAAAEVLGCAGIQTILLEKNSVIGPKVCAGGITKKDLDIGIPADLKGRSFCAMSLYSPSGRKTVLQQQQPFLRTLARPTLGQWMSERLSRHTTVTVRAGRTVVRIKNRSCILDNGEEIGFRYCIGADGSLSCVRRYLGIPVQRVMVAIQYLVPDRYEEISFFLESDIFGPGYAWIFPHARFTSIGCGTLSTHHLGQPLKQAFHTWLAGRNIHVGAALLEGWTINIDYRGHAFDNFFLVGDAAGFTSGLTGEGIYFAIASGNEIAKKIINPSYPTPELTRILRVKRRHEKLLALLTHSAMQRRFFHEAAVLLTKNQWIANKAIDLFG